MSEWSAEEYPILRVRRPCPDRERLAGLGQSLIPQRRLRSALVRYEGTGTPMRAPWSVEIQTHTESGDSEHPGDLARAIYLLPALEEAVRRGDRRWDRADVVEQSVRLAIDGRATELSAVEHSGRWAAAGAYGELGVVIAVDGLEATELELQSATMDLTGCPEWRVQ